MHLNCWITTFCVSAYIYILNIYQFTVPDSVGDISAASESVMIYGSHVLRKRNHFCIWFMFQLASQHLHRAFTSSEHALSLSLVLCRTYHRTNLLHPRYSFMCTNFEAIHRRQIGTHMVTWARPNSQHFNNRTLDFICTSPAACCN